MNDYPTGPYGTEGVIFPLSKGKGASTWLTHTTDSHSTSVHPLSLAQPQLTIELTLAVLPLGEQIRPSRSVQLRLTLQRNSTLHSLYIRLVKATNTTEAA